MKNFTRISAIALLAVFIFFGAAVKSINAATFTVNTKADTNDVTPGDGVCLDFLNNCSLRAAIEEANKLPGDDTINFSTTDLFGQTIVLDSLLTDIDITSNITINGLGASNLAVSGNNAIRVFNITSGTVIMSGFTIRDGNDVSPFGGGGILSDSSALTLTNMNISNNTANNGGGIEVFRGSLTMTGSTVSNNNTTGSGGGVVLNNVPSASITNSSVAGNNATGNSSTPLYGGGIYSTSSTVTLTGVSIGDNHAANTGGQAFGGGMFVSSGGATIINCAFGSNSTDNDGGGIYFSGGTHRISGTLFSANHATHSGGGFAVGSATVTAVNSTVSDNTALLDEGGGIYNLVGTLTLRNVTVAENRGFGGGIYNFTGSTITLANTIVADNRDITGTSPDIFGAINSLGNNLVRDRTGSSGYVASDLPDGTNPLLGALANNGGLTQTRALMAGSPAINNGNNAQALDSDNATPLTTDQRGAGFPRIVGGTVDIGAFEAPLGTTAASVTVGGRVLTANGRGIRNVLVTLTNTKGESRTILTGTFGAYRFNEVAAGQTYLVSVFAKRFQFGQNTQVLSLTDDIAGINFIANNSF